MLDQCLAKLAGLRDTNELFCWIDQKHVNDRWNGNKDKLDYIVSNQGYA